MAGSSEEWLERAERFLRHQKELFGDFSVPRGNQDSVEAESAAVVVTAATENTETVQSSIPVSGTESTPPSLLPSQRIGECNTLADLRSLCEQNEDLYTDLDGTQLVFGTGNEHADLMLIGEAPGEEEDKQGEPFVGAAGQLLNKILKAIELERKDVYIANILKHRPPNNRNPKPDECERSLPYLMRQIELVDPKLILCLGKVSGSVLLNNKGSLGSMRQQFHPFMGRELMVTYHPAALLRNEQWKRPTWEDVQLLKKRYDELTS